MTSCDEPSAIDAEYQPARGHSGAGGDHDVLQGVDLVHRRTSYLAGTFGDAVHAVDVGLAQLTPVRY